MSWCLLTVQLQSDADVALARQRARQLAELLGLEAPARVRLATAVSEIARNALRHAGGGRVEFWLEAEARPARLLARVSDQGSGIADVERVLTGANGQGLVGARRLVDEFQLESHVDQGTVVVLGLNLPAGAGPANLHKAAHMAGASLAPPEVLPLLWDELEEQNRALLLALEENAQLRAQVDELNGELESTNRGVVALYAELDEKAEQLRRADELKTRFFSNMSHEFRTPVNSILALSRLLLDRVDGALTTEQARQVGFIRQAAEELGDLVNDLLDLVKVEAGRIVMRPVRFEAATLFATLRATFRPLATNPAVALVVEEPAGLPALYGDEGKVAQVLRNFISNALKFTERGEVRVSAALDPAGRLAVFSVADTGIGIAPEDQGRIFQEFSQLENPIQKRVRGTGLGLALSKRLAELMGGRVRLKSQLGQGSTFSLEIPLLYAVPQPVEAGGAGPEPAPAERVLIIDDDHIARYLLRGMLADQACLILEAPDGPTGLRLARDEQPACIFLDLVMPDMDGVEVLDRLEAGAATHDIPVIIFTSQVLDDAERQALSARTVAVLSKASASREAALAEIRAALDRARGHRKLMA